MSRARVHGPIVHKSRVLLALCHACAALRCLEQEAACSSESLGIALKGTPFRAQQAARAP